MSETELAVGEYRIVPLEQISVEDGYNTRNEIGAQDVDELAELAISILTQGLINPITVEAAADDASYVVTAGERRFHACHLAELSDVPVIVREGNGSRLGQTIAENLHRRQLGPCEEARGFERDMAQQKVDAETIAAQQGKTPEFVRGRLRLLKLPDRVRALIDAGKVPVSAAGTLDKLAEVSPGLSHAIAHLLATKQIELADLEGKELGSVLDRCGWNPEVPDPDSDEDHYYYPEDRSYTWPEEGCPVKLMRLGKQELTNLILPDGYEGRDELFDRWARIEPERHSPRPPDFVFDEADADAARAYGCLVEVTDRWERVARYVTDPAWVADRVEQKLAEMETAGAKRRKERERAEAKHAAAELKEAAKAAGISVKAAGADPEALAKAKREAAEAEKARLYEVARKRHAANQQLGANAIRKLDRVKPTRAALKLLALTRYSSELRTLAMGFALCLDVHELKTYKNGREKVIYCQPDQAEEHLRRYLSGARGTEDYLGRFVQASVCAVFASKEVLSGARQHEARYALPGSYRPSQDDLEVRLYLRREALRVLPPLFKEELQAKIAEEERAERYDEALKARDLGALDAIEAEMPDEERESFSWQRERLERDLQQAQAENEETTAKGQGKSKATETQDSEAPAASAEKAKADG